MKQGRGGFLFIYIMNSSHYSARCVKITALIGGLAAATAVEVG